MMECVCSDAALDERAQVAVGERGELALAGARCVGIFVRHPHSSEGFPGDGHEVRACLEHPIHKSPGEQCVFAFVVRDLEEGLFDFVVVDFVDGPIGLDGGERFSNTPLFDRRDKDRCFIACVFHTSLNVDLLGTERAAREGRGDRETARGVARLVGDGLGGGFDELTRSAE